MAGAQKARLANWLQRRIEPCARTMTVFVGLDTSKMKISVALAEDGRQGEIRFFGDIDTAPGTVARLLRS